MENKANVLITGAGGFVGKVLTKLLVEQGYKVKALIRNRPVGFSHPNLEEIMVPDLIDLDRALLEGIEVVIHLAAHVHQMAQVKQHKKTYYQVNLDITSKLAEMVANSSVQQFIYLSTIKVNGEATAYNQSFNVIDEPCPQDDYAKSKYLAELKLQEILAQSAVAYTIIRAPLVYGPGAVGNYEHLAKLVQKNSLLLWPLGGIKNKRSLIHVNYLSTCIEQAILNPAVYNQLLLLWSDLDLQ